MRRWSVALACFALVGALLVSAQCGDDLPARCTLTTKSIAANALALLPDARLDRVANGFVLLGSSGDQVLWQTIDSAGNAGPLRTAAVPAHTDGPWFGVAGTPGAPGDHVVILYATNPSGDMATLTSMTFLIDGSAGTPPASAGMIPDRGAMKAPLLVSAGSGQAGQHMGLLWSLKGKGTVKARIFGSTGQPLGDEVSLGAVDNVDCPRFIAGQGDLTATFVKTSGSPPTQAVVAREFNADGSSGSTVNLGLVDWSADEAAGCVSMGASSSAYGFAWRTNSKTFSGDDYAYFDPTAGSGTYTPYQVLSDERASGGHAAPIVGLGKTADSVTRFILLAAEVAGGKAWEIDFQGHPLSQPVFFPSVNGNTGTFSSAPLAGSLYVTYADYTGQTATDHSHGARIFGQVTCH
jgi:hypothetical protein